MLTKRTNILFDEKLWIEVSALAKKEKTSVGSIVRSAIKEKLNNEEDLAQRRQVIDNILLHRPKPFKGKIDYKTLINAGKKY